MKAWIKTNKNFWVESSFQLFLTICRWISAGSIYLSSIWHSGATRFSRTVRNPQTIWTSRTLWHPHATRRSWTVWYSLGVNLSYSVSWVVMRVVSYSAVICKCQNFFVFTTENFYSLENRGGQTAARRQQVAHFQIFGSSLAFDKNQHFAVFLCWAVRNWDYDRFCYNPNSWHSRNSRILLIGT